MRLVLRPVHGTRFSFPGIYQSISSAKSVTSFGKSRLLKHLKNCCTSCFVSVVAILLSIYDFKGIITTFDKIDILRQKNIHRTHLNIFIDFALIRGVNANYLLSSISNPESDVITENEFWQVLTLIKAKIPDALLGIYAGRAMCVKALGLIYQISMQCTTVAEALFYLQSYIANTLPVAAMNVREESGQIYIILTPMAERSAACAILFDALLTIIEKELRLMNKGTISVACTSPNYNSEYPNNWSCANSYSLIASNLTLVASLHKHLNWNLATLVPSYLKLIENMQQEHFSFISQVKAMALNMSNPKLPTLFQLAANFNLTPRSFQRKLANVGCSFRQIINGLNRDISFYLSQHKTYKVNDIAAILGYSESAAYIRAKKRWQKATCYRGQSDDID
jgi:AraC-like DNA-binding protein